MPTILTNNAEGGTNGTAVTTANSGGSSGTAFTTVTAGTGGAITYDNTGPIHGALSYLFSQGTTSCFTEWNQTVLPALADYYGRCTLKVAAPTGEVPLFQGIGADLATQGWRLSILSSGKLRIRGGGTAPGTTLQDSTTVVASGSSVRIAWHVVSGTTAGSIEVRIFTNLESTVPAEVIGPLTNVNAGSDLSRLRIWNTSSTPVMPAGRLDDMVIQDTGGWPGPVIVFAAPTANYSYTTSQLTATFTDTSAAAGGGPTLTSWAWTFGDGTTSAVQNPPPKTYAQAGTYNVTLTVTDSLGRTGTVTKSVSLTPPASTVRWATINSSNGWTPVGTGDVLVATTDGVPSTYVTSLINPTDQPIDGTGNPITAVPAGTSLVLNVPTDLINGTFGSWYAKLYRGSTLLSTSAAVAAPLAHLVGGQPVTSLDQSIQLVFPAADVASVSNGDVLRWVLFGNAS